MKWALLLLAVVATDAQARRRPCASNGMSCVPGPCCRGTRCKDDVCRKPEKEWSEPSDDPTPDNPHPKKKTLQPPHR